MYLLSTYLVETWKLSWEKVSIVSTILYQILRQLFLWCLRICIIICINVAFFFVLHLSVFHVFVRVFVEHIFTTKFKFRMTYYFKKQLSSSSILVTWSKYTGPKCLLSTWVPCIWDMEQACWVPWPFWTCIFTSGK